jgi:hypothetical protein
MEKMRKFGFLSSLFFICFSMMFLSVVDDDGAGGGDDVVEDDDIGNLDLNDDVVDDGNITVPREDWERVNNFVQEGERRSAFESTVSAIKEDIPDFNEKVVVDTLNKMHKQNPEKASLYNNEAGFKAIWYETQKNAAKNDDVNGGNNKGSDGADFESALDGAMKGETGSLKQAISMAL